MKHHGKKQIKYTSPVRAGLVFESLSEIGDDVEFACCGCAAETTEGDNFGPSSANDDMKSRVDPNFGLLAAIFASGKQINQKSQNPT